MRAKRVVLRSLVVLGVLLAVAVGGGFAWARNATGQRLTRHFETHTVELPIPFPLTPAEAEALSAGAGNGDLAQLARTLAIARGKHLVESTYACSACHGEDFGGGVMIDSPPLGVLKGMNLTLGKGSATAAYTAADWDRIVRHGVKPDGTPAVMPSGDYRELSDRELSDIVSYIRSLPPVDREVPKPTFGPVGTALVATGRFELSAETLEHHTPHAVEAPQVAQTSAYGKHLAAICTGCHRSDFSGGPIASGDPAWPPALDLTPHPEGLAGWTWEDFLRAMQDSKGRDGRTLREPMATMAPYTRKMTETELRALWSYLQTLPPRPMGR